MCQPYVVAHEILSRKATTSGRQGVQVIGRTELLLSPQLMFEGSEPVILYYQTSLFAKLVSD